MWIIRQKEKILLVYVFHYCQAENNNNILPSAYTTMKLRLLHSWYMQATSVELKVKTNILFGIPASVQNSLFWNSGNATQHLHDRMFKGFKARLPEAGTKIPHKGTCSMCWKSTDKPEVEHHFSCHGEDYHSKQQIAALPGYSTQWQISLSGFTMHRLQKSKKKPWHRFSHWLQLSICSNGDGLWFVPAVCPKIPPQQLFSVDFRSIKNNNYYIYRHGYLHMSTWVCLVFTKKMFLCWWTMYNWNGGRVMQ